MDERVLQFRVGVVVVASAIIAVILVMLFGAQANVWQRRYEIHVKFPEAPGVTVDTPVRKSGVLIGRVSNVKLREEKEGGGVLVSIRVFDQFKLHRQKPGVSAQDLCWATRSSNSYRSMGPPCWRDSTATRAGDSRRAKN